MIVKLTKSITLYDGGKEKEKGKLLEVTRDLGQKLISEKKAVEVRSSLKKGVHKKDGKLTLDQTIEEKE